MNLNQYPHAEKYLQEIENNLANEESAKLEAERQANYELRAAKERAGLQKAETIEASLQPLYEKRAKLAQELEPVLADFWDVVYDIWKRESEALKAISVNRSFQDSPRPEDSLESIRRSLSLPD